MIIKMIIFNFNFLVSSLGQKRHPLTARQAVKRLHGKEDVRRIMSILRGLCYLGWLFQSHTHEGWVDKRTQV